MLSRGDLTADQIFRDRDEVFVRPSAVLAERLRGYLSEPSGKLLKTRIGQQCELKKRAVHIIAGNEGMARRTRLRFRPDPHAKPLP